ncbi:hypothetical protein DY000_02042923 [Brassica cretica]|uniref:Uncharacterized protein n=1 Tax=Brassica cretica TaxID=69181 RepID=A0ABQ7BKP4_BRACR|nr:hypothetical protein DY000_02042923 [Brassica cretica]
MHPVDHFASPNHCYQHFAIQPQSKRGHDDYSIGSWADSGFHESFAVDTVITSPNEEHTEEYDEDYWKEHAIEMSLQDERLETHKFTNTFPTSFDAVHSTLVDTHPRPAKQPLTSIDTHKGTSIDIRTAAKIQEQENIPSQTRDPDGHARAMDGRILQVSREDIADILQVANGPDNLFSQQRGTPDVIQTDPNNHVGVATTKINPDLSRQPKGQASIDGTTETSIDRVTPTSIDRDNSTSIDRRYECGNRAFDMYGARKFTWEQWDEYGVYRDECGHARGVAGEMIPVTKDNIRKLLERASLFEESHICLPEHVTSFTLTRLAPELYTEDEIDEMVYGICGTQEKLGEELKTLQLEKEATTSTSIDAPHATSIDVSLPTAQIPAKPQCSTQHRDEWEVSYIDTRINNVYCPLNNNVDCLSIKIELLQQYLDTIRKKDQQPATSIDMCTFTSLDAKVSAMNERLRTYEDMHDRFISPVMVDLNKLDPDGNARAMDGRILQVSREDIADILQVANGPDNLFSQQRGTPDLIQTDPNNHVGVATTEINLDLSRQPKGQASIDNTTETSIDRITPTSIERDNSTSIDRRYECGNRTFDMYGARKFTWEQRDEYEVYRYECGHARGVAGEMIPVTKDNIRKLLERASLFEESHICLPELYTKDEIDEMVFGICGAQEKLGEELKTLQLEKEATTSTSIDAPHATSIDVSLPTAQIPAEPQCSTQHKDEWEVSHIDTRINDVYCPLNNNVDWLSTKIKLLQQDLDTIRKKDQQPATSIDMCTFTSLDAKVSAINERLRTYEDMHDRFISPVMIDLNKLSSQLLHAQKDIENITNQNFLQAKSASIDRLRGPWIDGKKPVELLPYTAAEVDKITSKIYTALDTMEERLDKRCDDIYFPFDNKISGLDSHAEWLQKEVKAIQRQLAAQHQISASIDRTRAG